MAQKRPAPIGFALAVYGAVAGLLEPTDRKASARRRHTTARPDRGATGVLGRLDRLQQRWRPAAVAVGVAKKYGEDGGGRLAATMAYYAFFSVFPALLALVAVAGFVLDDDPQLRSDLIDTAVGQFPVIGESIARDGLSGSTAAVAVGLAGTVWAGLGAMLAAQHALNTVWDVPWHERPNAIASRLRGVLMFAVIGVGFVGATVLTNLVTSTALPTVSRLGIAVANTVVNVGLALAAFQILTRERLAWRSLVPGAVLAGTAIYGLQTLGSVLVQRYVANASDTYGAFALVIGLLAWFHLASQVTLISAEVNVVLARRLYPRTVFGDGLTDGDRRALAGFQHAAARHPAAEPASDEIPVPESTDARGLVDGATG